MTQYINYINQQGEETMFFKVNFDQPENELVREFLTVDNNEQIVSQPAVDITENASESVIVVELPGVKKEAIKINVENGWLILNGERKSADTKEVTRVLHREIEYRPFSRSIKLPHPVDANKISAQLENGLLKISLPKEEEVRSRTIEIK
jgi:HSP20 family protein